MLFARLPLVQMPLLTLNVADNGLYELMRERIGASLRGMRSRGRVVSGGGRGNSVRWGLA